LGSVKDPLQQFERAKKILKQIHGLAQKGLPEDALLQEGKTKT